MKAVGDKGERCARQGDVTGKYEGSPLTSGSRTSSGSSGVVQIVNGQRLSRSVLAGAFVALAVSSVAMEMVCIPAPADNSLARLTSARHVAVAKVESEAADPSGKSSTYTLATVRSYKGGARRLWARRDYCEDCGRLRVGDYVLVFASTERFFFSDQCDAPQPVYAIETKRAITMLDKQAHYRPLSLPEQALKPR